MICPHCSTAVKFDWTYNNPIKDVTDNQGYFLIHDICPNCEEPVIYYSLCNYHYDGHYKSIDTDDDGNYKIEKQIMLYPQKNKFKFPEHIPTNYYNDYEESLKVLSASPKASAALSRRLLQLILRESYGIKKRNLSDEIEEFINKAGIPSHITDAIDAIRQIGNLAAHPTKNKNTGEIVDVEPGEAEWLIEVNEALFDFCFIQPKKIEQRRMELNNKLKELGKVGLKKKK